MTATAVSTYQSGFCLTGNCGRCHGAIATKCTHACHADEAKALPARAGVAPEPKPEPTAPIKENATVLETLPVDKIVGHLANRDIGTEEELAELADSIRSVGLLQPITVAPDGAGGYEVVCGERRLEATKIAGFTEIEAIVRNLDPRGRAEARLVENLQRKDITPLEEARGYRDLKKLGVSERDIASRVGRPQSLVNTRLQLLKLPAEIQDDVGAKRIGLTDAQNLARLSGDKERMARVLESRKNFGAGVMAATIERELKDKETEARHDAAVAELKAAGVKVLDSRGTAVVIGKGYGRLGVDAKAHAAEPCHAAVVNDWDAAVVALCTETKRHGLRGASKLKGKVDDGSAARGASKSATPAEKEKAAKEAERRELLIEAQDTRRAFIRSKLLPTKAPKADPVFVDAVRRGLLAIEREVYLDVAGRLAGFIAEDQHGWNATAFLTEATPLQLAQLLLALAMSDVEENIMVTAHVADPKWSDTDDVKAHFDALVAAGYQLSDVERAQLGRK